MKLGTGITANSFINKVQRTTKVVQSADPQVECTSTKDKFKLNPAALDMLGIKANSTVRLLMIDKNIGVSDPEDLSPMADRFLIAVNLYGSENKGLVAKGGEFSYAGPWAVINSGRDDVTQIPHKDLCEQGLLLERPGAKGSNYISYKKFVFDLVRFKGEDDEGNVIDQFVIAEGAKPQPLYMMTNMRAFDHDPQTEE